MWSTTSSDRLSGFWADTAGQAIADSKGCYVFALANGGSHKPIYVGKTTRTFKSECFEYHKLEKVRDGLWNDSAKRPVKGTLVLFFFEYQSTVGKPNARVIEELETFLIATSAERNPDNLQNDRKAKNTVYYSIPGVINSPRGKPSDAALSVRQLLGLEKRS